MYGSYLCRSCAILIFFLLAVIRHGEVECEENMLARVREVEAKIAEDTKCRPGELGHRAR